MLDGKGKYGKVGNSHIIRLPPYVAKDSTFPFKQDEIVHVKIEKGRVIVEKYTVRSWKTNTEKGGIT